MNDEEAWGPGVCVREKQQDEKFALSVDRRRKRTGQGGRRAINSNRIGEVSKA